MTCPGLFVDHVAVGFVFVPIGRIPDRQQDMLIGLLRVIRENVQAYGFHLP